MISKFSWTEILSKSDAVKYIVTKLLSLFFFILRKFQSPFFNSSNKVIIISLHRLGDSVFTIPAINYLIEHYNQNVYLACLKETIPVYEHSLNNVNILSIENDRFKINGRWADRKTRNLVKKIEPEIIFDLNGDMLSLSLMLFSKACEIYGLSRPQFTGLYSKCTEIRKNPHIMDIYFDAVKTKFQVDQDEIKMVFPRSLKSNGNIFIHPFAGWAAKEWGINKFILIADKLKSNHNVKMIAQSGCMSEDIKLELAELQIDFIETANVGELIKNIKEASLFIGNDSGPTYVASLLGVPTFTLFGPSNPIFHLPFGNHNDYVNLNLNCSPQADEKLCFTNGGRNGCPSFECMNMLSVEFVQEKLNSFINKILV